MNAQEFLWTRPKSGRKSGRGRSGGFHVENEIGTKAWNKGGAKRIKKTIENVKQFRLKMR